LATNENTTGGPSSSGLNFIWRQRLDDLRSHLVQDLALLKEYEDELRYEIDPRRQANARRNIERLRDSIARSQYEYDELCKQVIGEPPGAMYEVGTQLEQMGNKLDALLEDVRDLRRTLLLRYDASEQAIITALTERFDQTELTAVKAVLDALETAQFSETEMHQLSAVTQQLPAFLEQHPATVPAQQALTQAIAAPTLDMKHKLKLTVPIIPYLLSYEGEWALGSGVNLKAVWQRLVAKMRGP
jgi:hypothetical protein